MSSNQDNGNAVALREALSPFPSLCDWLVENAAKLGISDMVAKLRERGDKARAALAATATAEKSSGVGDAAKQPMAEEIKLTREEERAIDKKLGPNFKKDMNEFAEKLQDLMVEFPMAQGHSKEARYLQQPFYMMSGALHLTKRFCMTERERDEDDDRIASISTALDALAGAFGGSGIQEKKGVHDGSK